MDALIFLLFFHGHGLLCSITVKVFNHRALFSLQSLRCCFQHQRKAKQKLQEKLDCRLKEHAERSRRRLFSMNGFFFGGPTRNSSNKQHASAEVNQTSLDVWREQQRNFAPSFPLIGVLLPDWSSCDLWTACDPPSMGRPVTGFQPGSRVTSR